LLVIPAEAGIHRLLPWLVIPAAFNSEAGQAGIQGLSLQSFKASKLQSFKASKLQSFKAKSLDSRLRGNDEQQQS